jgi:hypothetical protein
MNDMLPNSAVPVHSPGMGKAGVAVGGTGVGVAAGPDTPPPHPVRNHTTNIKPNARINVLLLFIVLILSLQVLAPNELRTIHVARRGQITKLRTADFGKGT